MAQYVHYSMCDVNGGSQYIGHANDQLLYEHTVSTEHLRPQSMRKRQLSDENNHSSRGTQSQNNEHKKSKQCDSNNMSSAPHDNAPTNRIETLLLQLSSNLNNVSQKLERRIDELETNFEERVSQKLSEKISEIIDNKLKDKIDEVKLEVKSDIEIMQARIGDLEKSLAEANSSKEENENKEVTTNKVQALLKDGLALLHISLKSVERKEAYGKSTGLVIVEVEDFEHKQQIMKHKKNLKNSEKYKKVYVEHDLPMETRNFQATVRTVLKEIGSQNNYMFAGSRLVKKQ
ncbi:Hypothetical predicted protein [Mytilus galloprovincialis]|nr:Hypothetical predicted protein [Mytilus galloprovincialis]